MFEAQSLQTGRTIEFAGYLSSASRQHLSCTFVTSLHILAFWINVNGTFVKLWSWCPPHEAFARSTDAAKNSNVELFDRPGLTSMVEATDPCDGHSAKAFSILMMGVVSSPCWWVRGSSEYKTDLQTNDGMAWRSGKWCRTLALPYIMIHDNEVIHQGTIVKLLFQFKCLLFRNPNNRHFMPSSQYCSLQLRKLRSCPVSSCSLTLLDRLGRQLLKPWPQTF